MTEPTAETGMLRLDDIDGKPTKRKARKRPADVEEGAFPRLQERTQTQLGFINNLLVTLAVGLLAFAVNASANSTDLDQGWRKVVLSLGLVALAFSVLAGLQTGFQPAGLSSHHHPCRPAPPAP